MKTSNIIPFRDFILEKFEWNEREGESEVVHHSSEHDFNEFRPLSHFGTKNAARARAYAHEYPSLKKANRKEFNHYSVRLNLGKSVEVSDYGGTHTASKLASSLRYRNHITPEEHEEFERNLSNYEPGNAKVLTMLLKRKGINTLFYHNTVEDPGSKSYIITDPKQVRILRKSKSLINLKRGKASLSGS